jgi:CRP-like cAMP-binding protein
MGTGRFLPDGIPLRNLLLGALPGDVYAAVAKDLRLIEVDVGEVLHEDGVVVRDVYFPNGGVFSVTNQMRDGSLVEVATVGIEGMLGVNVYLGDALAAGSSLQQVPDGALPTMAVQDFLSHMERSGSFRALVARYAQFHVLQIMQCVACNALHELEPRCCRWLLQTHDRVGADEFQLKHEFLAVMLGVSRPTVTVALGTLQKAGLIAGHYGRIQILDRKNLEAASCECYEVIAGHLARLGPPSIPPPSAADARSA